VFCGYGRSLQLLAVTSTEMGFVKDPYAFKPLVVAETDDFVAVATEEIAIRSAIPGSTKSRKHRLRRCGFGRDSSTRCHRCRNAFDQRSQRADRSRLQAGAAEVCVANPNARHNLGVALLQPGRVRFLGSVGYTVAD